MASSYFFFVRLFVIIFFCETSILHDTVSKEKYKTGQCGYQPVYVETVYNIYKINVNLYEKLEISDQLFRLVYVL